jgi:MerR family copper efflux transcriptional regulator
MNIGEIAAAAGVSAKMIRYYESIDLIKAPIRTDGGYRVYMPDDVHTLRFIGRARDLGFSIEEISSLLALWHDRSRASSDVKRIAVEKLATLEAKILELNAMAATLRHLAENCHGDHRPDCPILSDLAEPKAASSSGGRAGNLANQKGLGGRRVAKADCGHEACRETVPRKRAAASEKFR